MTVWLSIAFYITVKSVCVYLPCFEPNQNGHNSVKFEARTSIFCMVVDLEKEEDNNDDADSKHNIFCLFGKAKKAERSEANPAE